MAYGTTNGDKYAGYFSGNVLVSGTLTEPAAERGNYIHSDVFGAGEEQGISAERAREAPVPLSPSGNSDRRE